MRLQSSSIFWLLGEVCTVTIVGARTRTYDQRFFLGVLFASPPVGDLRLQKSVPPKSWDNIRVANTYSNWCMGIDINLPGFSQNVTGQMSEDCLYLNIVRPAHILATAKLPVIAWIYAGGFLAGSANNLRYNGSFLVENPVKMDTPVILRGIEFEMVWNGRL